MFVLKLSHGLYEAYFEVMPLCCLQKDPYVCGEDFLFSAQGRGEVSNAF